jgi:hypothetical protein
MRSAAPDPARIGSKREIRLASLVSLAFFALASPLQHLRCLCVEEFDPLVKCGAYGQVVEERAMVMLVRALHDTTLIG